MKEGFLIGGGLIIAGLMLELSAGPIDWDSFRWPVNGIVLAGFLALIAAIFLLRKKVYGFQFIGTYNAAIPALVYAIVLTIIMGLTRSLSLLTSILNHLGLFLAMTTATLGNADMQRLKMITVKGEPEWRALTDQQQIVEMPIAIELKEFIMETYDDGSPKRFASDIQILTQTGKNIETTVEVNKPVEVDGWKIYQYGYDTQMGAMSQTSILELVSDPWLPLVYTGIYMMLAGAVCMFLFGGRKKIAKSPNSQINSK